MDNTELEDFDLLVNSDGWTRFSKIVQDTYGRTSDRFFNAVTAAAAGDNPHAQDHLRQIIAEQRGALEALAIPANRLKVLRQSAILKLPEAMFIGSRRGGL